MPLNGTVVKSFTSQLYALKSSKKLTTPENHVLSFEYNRPPACIFINLDGQIVDNGIKFAGHLTQNQLFIGVAANSYDD
uniref:Uncharacterized protein n=1 Tax=Romanomermis culicivorax TaxID=13658 RepID=A0A915HKL7_ROMCU